MKSNLIITTFDFDRSPIFFKTLEYKGFVLQSIPILSLSMCENLTDFDECAKKLRSFGIVIFSSPTMVRYFFSRLLQLEIKPTKLDSCKLIAVGSATAKALRLHGFSPDFVPQEFTSSCLIKTLLKINGRIKILIPCSNRSLWHVEKDVANLSRISTPVLYTNGTPLSEDTQKIVDVFNKGFEGIVFTCPSSIKNLSTIYGDIQVAEILKEKVVACIGPTTSKACVDRGIDVTIQPGKYTYTSLMWSVINHFGAREN